MLLFSRSFALCAVVAITVGLAQAVEAVNESGTTSVARQGPRRLARSDRASLAASSDQAVTAQEKQLVETGHSSLVRKRKRCYYVGTFFHRIDCNAPANSTSVPYSHAPEPTAEVL
ncbi:hypothetical protein NBRC10512_001098 [Rhodotorula toruloides]|uniref:RHTO0S06e11386g1_1 n=2 Tax=Rhodotorula toruloides TaxID=5286 RepID=A0A061AYC1_RHOTO|nr:uncharacterized protein RHTO_04380 [Rhodotorula toruloides NP11]EMS19379.1 hypothetical protein RHTO_04380 [Rhodotorula toruloides NP11]CDR42240.1 RHTO0S06e11386g1_1 [Rhodotorula toruloides]